MATRDIRLGTGAITGIPENLTDDQIRGLFTTVNGKGEFTGTFEEFVDREAAAKIAFKAGQIERIPKVLFSEDFWSVMYGGKHDYDTEKGYVERSPKKGEK